MFFFFKQKIVFGFLLSVLSFINVFPMELGQNSKNNKTMAEQSALAFYEMILNKVQSHKEIVDIIKTAQTRYQILNLAESAVSDSLNLNLEALAKNQKFFEEFSKSLATKMISSLDSILVYVQSSDVSSSSNGLSKLSVVVKMDECDKINLTVSLMQSIKESLKPSGLIRLDKDKLKAACKQCGTVTCICGGVCCVAITCAGVGYQHPEVCLSCVKSFPKSSACGLFTALTYCFDKCCCKGYLFKECCSAIKKMLCGIKCCGCCNDDDNKDFKV